MSHTVTIIMHADQLIEIQGTLVNIYEIQAIMVNSQGQITNALVSQQVPPTQWIKEKK